MLSGKLFRTQSRLRNAAASSSSPSLSPRLPSAPAAAGRGSPGRTPRPGRDPAWDTHPERRWADGPRTPVSLGVAVPARREALLPPRGCPGRAARQGPAWAEGEGVCVRA